MAKIKLENKTQSKIFLGGYCFVPGITETCDLTKAEETNINKLLETKPMKARIKSKLLIIHKIEEEQPQDETNEIK